VLLCAVAIGLRQSASTEQRVESMANCIRDPDIRHRIVVDLSAKSVDYRKILEGCYVSLSRELFA
jgi:hypothetical protein